MTKFHGRYSDAEQRAIAAGGSTLCPGPWEKLRATVWLSYVFYKTEWDWKELKEFVSQHRTRSSLVPQWELGETYPSRSSARKLRKKVKGSFELFELPLWRLLANRPRSASECRKAIKPFLRDGRTYSYPQHCPLAERALPFEPSHRGDSAAMVRRGDIYALTTAVALLREAEAEYRDRQFVVHIANLYRMLVPLSKTPYMVTVIPALAQFIDTLRRRLVLADFSIGVDWKLLEYQILHPIYDPQVRLRPYSEFDGKCSCDIDPVIYADFVRKRSIGAPSDLHVALCDSVGD